MAKGKVMWTNPPKNAGSIERTDDGSNDSFVYNVRAGHTEGDYTPSEGDDVNFTPQGGVATGISLADASDPGTPPADGTP